MDASVRNSFETIGSTNLKNNLNKAKTDGKKPNYLNDNVYAKAKEFWALEAFKRQSKVNKSNRLNEREGLGPSTHCGGSRSATKRIIHLEKELKRKPNRSEIYFSGKYSEKKNKFVVKKAEHIWDRFLGGVREQEKNSQGSKEATSNISIKDESLSAFGKYDDMWVNGVEKVQYGLVYGFGSAGRSFLRLDDCNTSSPAVPTPSPPAMVDPTVIVQYDSFTNALNE